MRALPFVVLAASCHRWPAPERGCSCSAATENLATHIALLPEEQRPGMGRPSYQWWVRMSELTAPDSRAPDAWLAAWVSEYRLLHVTRGVCCNAHDVRDPMDCLG